MVSPADADSEEGGSTTAVAAVTGVSSAMPFASPAFGSCGGGFGLPFLLLLVGRGIGQGHVNIR
jgi:hypothetical protein